jgi:hypothetical protein
VPSFCGEVAIDSLNDAVHATYGAVVVLEDQAGRLTKQGFFVDRDARLTDDLDLELVG